MYKCHFDHSSENVVPKWNGSKKGGRYKAYEKAYGIREKDIRTFKVCNFAEGRSFLLKLWIFIVEGILFKVRKFDELS